MKQKKLINERYEISLKKIVTKNGEKTYAYIDPIKSTDSTYAIKDDIKKYGAQWDKYGKTWGWILSSEKDKLETQLQNYVYPAIKFLNSVETYKDGEEKRSSDDMIKKFQKVLNEIDQIIAAPAPSIPSNIKVMSEKEVKEKLVNWKEDLVNTMSSEEFLRKLDPIIKFHRATGYVLSLSNTILIMMQDPEAKMVKAKGTWEKIYNRRVREDAPALWIYLPSGSNKLSKETEDYLRQKFLAKVGKKSEEELTSGERDRLRVFIKGKGGNAFKLMPVYYDIRFTEQIEGTEDVVGDPNADIEWSDDKSAPTELTESLYNAMIEVIKEHDIKLEYVNDLGGAKGVSKSGTIVVLSNDNKNAGSVNTLVHEFSHELLHQRYLKEKSEEWAAFFVGKEQGRGMVEQQAELSAYIVLLSFGIKLPQSLNYAAIWGADATKAAKVFDTVASVASYIIKKIGEQLKVDSQMNESMDNSNRITGEYVASLLGPKALAVYQKSKKMEAQNGEEIFRISESLLKEMIYNSILKMLK